MKQNDKLYIIICHCEGFLCSDKTISAMKSVFEESVNILDHRALCTEMGLKEFAESVRKAKVVRSVVAGCSKVYDETFLRSLAEALDMARDSLFPINIGTADIQASQNKPDLVLKQINKAFKAASYIPAFKKKSVSLDQTVLVIGGGIAGISAARQVHDLGYGVVQIEKEDSLGGVLSPGVADSNKTAVYDCPIELGGIEVHTRSVLITLEGTVGAFRAGIRGPGGEEIITCGAVIVATGRFEGLASRFLDDFSAKHQQVCAIPGLAIKVSALPGNKETRRIALVLDFNVEETKAGAEMSFHLALELQKDKKNQVFLFCRETRVSAKPLESLFDKVQDSGVVIVKYEDKPVFNMDQSNDKRTEIVYTDTVLQKQLKLSCDLIGVSFTGIDPGVDPGLAELTGLTLDALGQFQDNNVHLFPGKTNRPGIFVAGACSGRDYIPGIITGAGATALSVHKLLSKKNLEVELSTVTVDEDKCILCLSCIRSCPFHAMVIDKQKDVAKSIPEVCQKCGSCAGECPVKAITLPAYSDDVILSQIDYE